MINGLTVIGNYESGKEKTSFQNEIIESQQGNQ